MSNGLFFPGIQYAALAELSRGLSYAFASKQPLSNALESLSGQRKIKKTGPVLRLVSAGIQNGLSPAQAFFEREKQLGFFFCEAFKHGEKSENPARFFSRLADFYDANDHFRKKIFDTLKYPAIILTVATVAIVTLLAIIVPDAVRSIPVNTGDLPPATRIVLQALTISPHALLALLIIALIFFACAWYPNVKSQRPEKRMLKNRFFGNLFRKLYLRRIACSISFLLSNGAGISDALRITAETSRRTPYRDKLLKALKAAQETAVKNASLFTALKDAGDIFPPSFFDLPRDKEEPKSEKDQLLKIAEFYEDEIVTAVTVTAIVIEPVAVAIAGLMTGGILAALYLPLLRTAFGR